MTGQGPFDPKKRGKTPEERVDDLVIEIKSDPNKSLCDELREALDEIAHNDDERRMRASEALEECEKNKH